MLSIGSTQGMLWSTQDPDPTEEGPLRTQYWRGIRHLMKDEADEMTEAIRQRKMEREFCICDLFIPFFAWFLSQTGEDSTQ